MGGEEEEEEEVREAAMAKTTRHKKVCHQHPTLRNNPNTTRVGEAGSQGRRGKQLKTKTETETPDSRLELVHSGTANSLPVVVVVVVVDTRVCVERLNQRRHRSAGSRALTGA